MGDLNFIRPMVFENYETENHIYIFGGCQSFNRNSRDKINDMYEIELVIMNSDPQENEEEYC